MLCRFKLWIVNWRASCQRHVTKMQIRHHKNLVILREPGEIRPLVEINPVIIMVIDIVQIEVPAAENNIF